MFLKKIKIIKSQNQINIEKITHKNFPIIKTEKKSLKR